MNFLKRFGVEIVRTALIVLLLSGVMAAGQVYKWSSTAGTNANVDPHINWAEGMAPSAVNDSARATMAELAKWRDDTSGLLAAGGTSTAYTVATNQGLPTTPNDGQLIAFTPGTTNGTAVTLAADGGTAYPIQTSPGVAVGAGTLIQGTPYSVKFSSSSSAWMLRDFYANPYSIPLGGIIPYVGTTAPNSNFVLPYGQCISRTTYATFFALVGTTYGACDGTTTFAVPDYRGRVLAGKDDMGGSAASRLTSTYFGTSAANLGASGGAESQTLLTANLPPYTPSGTVAVTNGVLSQIGVQTGGSSVAGGSQAAFSPTTVTITAAFTGTPQGGTSTAFKMVQPTIICNYIIRII